MSIYNYFSNGNPVQGAIFGILFAISIIVILYGDDSAVSVPHVAL